MAGKRRGYGAPSRAKVARAAAKGDQTTAKLAGQLGIHTSHFMAWKKHVAAQVVELFDKKLPRSSATYSAGAAARFSRRTSARAAAAVPGCWATIFSYKGRPLATDFRAAESAA